MEISRYASKLASKSSTMFSDRPRPFGGLSVNKVANKSSGTSPFDRACGELQEEPEDACLTGGTRSLARRLLALNIPGLSSVIQAPVKRVSLLRAGLKAASKLAEQR